MEIVALLAVFGAISAAIASNRGSSVFGFFFVGVMLGPIGIVLALVQGANCSACRKRIHTKATVCPHCQTGQQAMDSKESEPQPAPIQPYRPPKHEISETKGWIIAGLVFLIFAFVITRLG